MLTDILCARGTLFPRQFCASISVGQKINTVSRLLCDERARAYLHWNSVASSVMKKLLKFNFAELKVYSSATFNYSSDSHTHFFFNGCFYDQVDGVALGFPPLVPVLVNFFMGHYEKLWL